MAENAVPAGASLLLSVSHLAPGIGYGAFVRIVQACRSHNQAAGLRGMLVFDGARFCHVVEGPAWRVARLEVRMAADARHVDRRVLLRGAAEAPRWFSLWRSGFCAPAELEALFHCDTLSPAEARPLLQTLAAVGDLAE